MSAYQRQVLYVINQLFFSVKIKYSVLSVSLFEQCVYCLYMSTLNILCETLDCVILKSHREKNVCCLIATKKISFQTLIKMQRNSSTGFALVVQNKLIFCFVHVTSFVATG